VTIAPVRLRRFLAEGVGTFFLVLIGPGAVMVNAFTGGVIGQAGVALAFGFVVIAMIYALGHLSGAHINPAVTLGFWSARRFPTAEVLPYILAQCAGAVAASLVLRAMLGPVGHMAVTSPTIGIPGAFAMEWLMSFALMFVIMALATDERVGRLCPGRGGRDGVVLRDDGRAAHRGQHEPGALARTCARRRRVVRALAQLGGTDHRNDRRGVVV
jgi:glycerol uptake facilitator-like aquaporin